MLRPRAIKRQNRMTKYNFKSVLVRFFREKIRAFEHVRLIARHTITLRNIFLKFS